MNKGEEFRMFMEHDLDAKNDWYFDISDMKNKVTYLAGFLRDANEKEFTTQCAYALGQMNNIFVEGLTLRGYTLTNMTSDCLKAYNHLLELIELNNMNHEEYRIVMFHNYEKKFFSGVKKSESS